MTFGLVLLLTSLLNILSVDFGYRPRYDIYMRSKLVSDAEVYQTVRSELTISERAILDDVVAALFPARGPGYLGGYLLIQCSRILLELLADHLSGVPSADGVKMSLLESMASTLRMDERIDLEQLSLLAKEGGTPGPKK